MKKQQRWLRGDILKAEAVYGIAESVLSCLFNVYGSECVVITKVEDMNALFQKSEKQAHIVQCTYQEAVLLQLGVDFITARRAGSSSIL